MARPRTPIGTFGDISYVKSSGGQVRARTRFRDDDGKVRRVLPQEQFDAERVDSVGS